MKGSLLAAVLWFGACDLASGEPAVFQQKKFLVVRITDMDKSETNTVMSLQEFQDFQLQIRKEAGLFPRALENARQAWAKDESLKGQYFPRAAIVPRKTEQRGTPYMDEASALNKLEGIRESEKAYRDRVARQEQERENQRRRYSGGSNQPTANQQSDTRRKEKEELLRQAVDLVKAELDKLKPAGKTVPAVDMKVAPGAK